MHDNASTTDTSRLEDQMRSVRNNLRFDPDLNLDHIQRVISIVSPSRSGSSVFKWCVASHPDVCALAGEEEPYYKLALNGYPWHESDAFCHTRNSDFIRTAIANELGNHESVFNRTLLQTANVEESPFVGSIECKKKPVLVLKTPQNIYRRGVMEWLFPGRDIDYVFLSRGFAQTVNGLMDGWMSQHFKARLVGDKWWRFDMPPGWSFEDRLFSRCHWQWKCACLHGLGDYSDAIRVKFEDFLRDRTTVCDQLFDQLGLAPFEVQQPPVLMSTEAPDFYRWKKRGPLLMTKAEISEPIMRALDYSMDVAEWI